MNLENQKISALLINADDMMRDSAFLNQTLQHSLMCPEPNQRLVRAIENILYNDIIVIWISSMITDAEKHPLKSMIGDLYKKTLIIEQDIETAKHNQNFYEKLVCPMLEKRNISLDEVILISTNKQNNIAAHERKIFCANVAVGNPEKLAQYLEFVNLCKLFSGTC